MTERLHSGDPAFGGLLRTIERSWFRLETLQHYDVADERDSFEAFQSGRPMPHDPDGDEWTAMVRRHRSGGKVLQRVHVILEPLTPYVEYEVAWGYRAGLDGGEDIRVIVSEEAHWPSQLPANHDFWLLDDDLWIMTYDDQGCFKYMERSEEPADLSDHRQWRDVALAGSIPVGEYVSNVPRLRMRAVS